MNEYYLDEVCGFRKVKEQWGIFSNMSPHPVVVNGFRIPTTEALYQAMKYPHNPELQLKIINQKSPMSAKMVQKGHTPRRDWDQIKIDVMEWCLRVKVLYHSSKIRKEIEEVNGRDIIEISHKDRFWGAVPDKQDPNILLGENILGQLWMDIRNRTDFNSTDFLVVETPDIPNFLLYNTTIETIDRRNIKK
jgi:ribA/ribD-fused uncharacterized protein